MRLATICNDQLIWLACMCEQLFSCDPGGAARTTGSVDCCPQLHRANMPAMLTKNDNGGMIRNQNLYFKISTGAGDPLTFEWWCNPTQLTKLPTSTMGLTGVTAPCKCSPCGCNPCGCTKEAAAAAAVRCVSCGADCQCCEVCTCNKKAAEAAPSGCGCGASYACSATCACRSGGSCA